MPNIYDQFDAPAVPPQSGNVYDQFDAPNQTYTGTVPVAEPQRYGGPSIIHTVEDLWNMVKTGGQMATGQAPIPQSANMPETVQPGGENTQNIPAMTGLAASFTPLSAGGAAFKLGAPTGPQLKAAATQGYNQALKVPIELKPEAMDSFGRNLESVLYNDGITPDVAPKSFAILGKMSGGPNGATVTPQNLRSIQKSFGVIKNMSPDPAERMVSGRMLGEFNNLLENMGQAPSALAKGTPEDAAQFSNLVKEANGNYQAYKQGESFDQRGENAGYDAHAANSGLNLENNLRNQVKQILKNPKLQRGYDPATLQAMKDYNNGSQAANTLRLLGNLGGGSGGLGMLASGAVSHAMGLPFEAGPAVGFALKNAGNKIALNKFNNIGDMIRANSPLAASGVTSRVPINPLLSRLSVTMPMLGIQPEQPQ